MNSRSLLFEKSRLYWALATVKRHDWKRLSSKPSYLPTTHRTNGIAAKHTMDDVGKYLNIRMCKNGKLSYIGKRFFRSFSFSFCIAILVYIRAKGQFSGFDEPAGSYTTIYKEWFEYSVGIILVIHITARPVGSTHSDSMVGKNIHDS